MKMPRFTLMEEAVDAGADARGGAGGGGGGSLIKGEPTTHQKQNNAPASGGDAGTKENWWKGLYSEDGTIDKGRYAHLPEALKGDKSIFDRYANISEVFKALGHHSRTAREKGLMAMPEGATPEQEAEFLARRAKINGAPEKAEGYGIKRPDNVPEELWNEDIAQGMAKAFHARGLAPGDVKAVMEAHTQLVQQQAEAIQAEEAKQLEGAWKKNHETIRNAFGPFMDQRLKEAQAGAQYLGIDLNHPALTASPEFQAVVILAAQKVATKISDAKFVDGGSSGSSGRTAKAELEAMATDPSHKFHRVLTDESYRSTHQSLYEEAIAERRKLANRLAQEAEARR